MSTPITIDWSKVDQPELVSIQSMSTPITSIDWSKGPNSFPEPSIGRIWDKGRGFFLPTSSNGGRIRDS